MTKRQPLLTKTIGIAEQNDRNCRALAVDLLHTSRSIQHNTLAINILTLHVRMAQKADQGIYFLFFAHSQRV